MVVTLAAALEGGGHVLTAMAALAGHAVFSFIKRWVTAGATSPAWRDEVWRGGRAGSFDRGHPSKAVGANWTMSSAAGSVPLPVRQAAGILDTCICIPCMMPFITSQFLPRETGDRPAVLPAGMHNLAFIGQFCEVPDDVVFTVEYSVRSAQLAAYGLLDLQLKPPRVYKGKFDPRVLLKASRALHDIDA
jgi:hypothetical protein